jgi:hypothetical protein
MEVSKGWIMRADLLPVLSALTLPPAFSSFEFVSGLGFALMGG